MRMTMPDLLEIKYYGCEVLSQKARPVAEITDEIRTLVDNMIYTMYKSDGCGLAAPQIGVSLSIFVCDPMYSKTCEQNPIVFINPTFLEFDGETTFEEGCLSFPNVYENTERFEYVKVSYRDMEFKEQIYEATDRTAVIIQHETDHLNGIIMTDRMNAIRKMAHAFKLKKISEKGKKMSNELTIVTENDTEQ